MYTQNISLIEFSKDVLDTSGKYAVDIGELLGTNGASPVHVYYKTDEIVVFNTYPETIILVSGDSQINISQIQKIVKNVDDYGDISYKVYCGNSEWLKTTVVITQIN